MKRFIGLFMLLCSAGYAQVNVYSCRFVPTAELQAATAPIEGYCLNVPPNSGVYHSGAEVKVIEAAKSITIHQGTTIGSFSPGGGFIARLAPPPLWDDIVLFEPNDITQVPQLEKMELGIGLPDSIQQKIDAFIADANDPNGLNPFLEWELKVTGTFVYDGPFPQLIGSTKEVDGFYYRDYQRDVTAPNMKDWTWNAQTTPYPMRLRFAPKHAGNWKAKIRVEVNGQTVLTCPEFTINVVNSSNKGYMTVDPSGRYFRLDNATFFPAAQNLPWPRCENCFTNSNGDPSLEPEPYRKEPMGPAQYIVYEDWMTSLANNGGNYFRMLIAPWNTEIEFEHLGNYSNRMMHAWELDKIIARGQQLDLRMTFNLQVHFYLENPTRYGMHYWDWNSNPWDDPDDIYCYKRELGLTDPVEYVTDAEARKYQKQRLRYYLSRYGYSTHIGIFELFSEINNIGNVWLDADGDGSLDKVFSPYNSTVDQNGVPHDPMIVQDAVEAWHDEMSTYIKSELKYNQLVGVNYTGRHQPADQSYKKQFVDVAGYNWYSADPDKYGIHLPNIVEDIRVNDGVFKPLIHSEIGPGNATDNCVGDIEWYRDVWMGAFSGAAISAPWGFPGSGVRRQILGELRYFMEGVDVGEPGNTWEPFHDQWNQNDNNKIAEVVYLRSQDQMRAVGAINNRTINWKTVRDQSLDPSNCFTYPMLGAFNSMLDVDFVSIGQNRLSVDGLIFGQQYFVNYFDPRTSQYLGQSVGYGPKVTLQFPTLDQDLPLVAFQLHPAGELFKSIASSESSIKPSLDSADKMIVNEIENVKIYPNPSNGIFTVATNNLNDIKKITVRSQLGHVITVVSSKSSEIELNLPGLSSGIYMVEVMLRDTIIVRKIVIF